MQDAFLSVVSVLEESGEVSAALYLCLVDLVVYYSSPTPITSTAARYILVCSNLEPEPVFSDVLYDVIAKKSALRGL
jgi:hypothetical protein